MGITTFKVVLPSSEMYFQHCFDYSHSVRLDYVLICMFWAMFEFWILLQGSLGLFDYFFIFCLIT